MLFFLGGGGGRIGGHGGMHWLAEKGERGHGGIHWLPEKGSGEGRVQSTPSLYDSDDSVEAIYNFIDQCILPNSTLDRYSFFFPFNYRC